MIIEINMKNQLLLICLACAAGSLMFSKAEDRAWTETCAQQGAKRQGMEGAGTQGEGGGGAPTAGTKAPGGPSRPTGAEIAAVMSGATVASAVNAAADGPRSAARASVRARSRPTRALLDGDRHVASGLLGGAQRLVAAGLEQLARLLGVPARDARRRGLLARSRGAHAVHDLELFLH